jgi:diketogulonate reductase-like aldo/keto reductase
MSIPAVKLNTGALMPTIGKYIAESADLDIQWTLAYYCIIGLGASAGKSPEARNEAYNWILSALQVSCLNAWLLVTAETAGEQVGYRHIDTAWLYRKELWPCID